MNGIGLMASTSLPPSKQRHCMRQAGWENILISIIYGYYDYAQSWVMHGGPYLPSA